jgi:hypothetical protein
MAMHANAADRLQTLAAELHLPNPAQGTLEVRVWVQWELSTQHQLFRFFQEGKKITGERIVWGYSDGSMFAKYGARDCPSDMQRGTSLVWCAAHPIPIRKWDMAFRSLPVNQLWNLRAQSLLGRRPCDTVDGVGVGVELLTTSKRSAIWYTNPGSCCPWPECKAMLEVLEAVSPLR